MSDGALPAISHRTCVGVCKKSRVPLPFQHDAGSLKMKLFLCQLADQV